MVDWREGQTLSSPARIHPNRYRVVFHKTTMSTKMLMVSVSCTPGARPCPTGRSLCRVAQEMSGSARHAAGCPGAGIGRFGGAPVALLSRNQARRPATDGVFVRPQARRYRPGQCSRIGRRSRQRLLCPQPVAEPSPTPNLSTTIMDPTTAPSGRYRRTWG